MGHKFVQASLVWAVPSASTQATTDDVEPAEATKHSSEVQYRVCGMEDAGFDQRGHPFPVTIVETSSSAHHSCRRVRFVMYSTALFSFLFKFPVPVCLFAQLTVCFNCSEMLAPILHHPNSTHASGRSDEKH